MGVGLAAAQTAPMDAGEVARWRAAFQAERAAAPAGPARDQADQLAQRAELAARAGQTRRAIQGFRAARVSLPWVTPANPDRATGTAPLRLLGGPQARLQQADRINSLAITPDGRRLVSASRDGTVAVWNLENERLERLYTEHQSKTATDDPLRVVKAVISPNGELVASSGGTEIHLWKLATGERLQTLQGHTATARALAFSPDGQQLASGGDDRQLILWSVGTGQLERILNTERERIESCAFHPTAPVLVTVNLAGIVSAYELRGKAKGPYFQQTVIEGNEAAYGVGFVANRWQVLICGGDQKIRLQPIPEPGQANPNPLASLRTYTAPQKLYDLAIRSDGTKFCAVGVEATARIWNTESGQLLRSIPIPANVQKDENREMGLSAVALSPVGDWLAVGTVEGLIQLHSLEPQDASEPLGTSSEILWAVAVDDSGRRLAVAGQDRVITVRDAVTGAIQAELRGHQSPITSLWFWKPQQLLSAAGDQTVRLWDLETKQELKVFSGHRSAVLSLAIDPSRGRLLSGGADQLAILWNGSGQELSRWNAKTSVAAAALAPDGELAYLGGTNGLLEVVRFSGQQPVAVGSVQAHGSGVSSMSLQADGQRLLTTGGDGLAKWWDVSVPAAPKMLLRFELPRVSNAMPQPLSSGAIHPRLPILATAGADQQIRLWHLDTANELAAWPGARGWISQVVFSPTGDRLWSVGVDKTLRGFDLPASLASPRAGHLGEVKAVASLPQRDLIATAGNDRRIKLWQADTGEAIATLLGANGPILSLGFLSEEELVSVEEGKLRIWSVSGRREVKSVPLPLSVQMMQTDPIRKEIVVLVLGEVNQESTTQFLRFDQAGNRIAIMNHPERPSCATWTGKTARAATGEGKAVRIWEFGKAEPVSPEWAVSQAELLDLAFREDGEALLGLDREGARFLATLKDRQVKRLPVIPGAAMIVTQPGGSRHAVLSSGGDVFLCDESGATLQRWKLPAPGTCLSFSPDGSRLIVGLKNGTTSLLSWPRSPNPGTPPG